MIKYLFFSFLLLSTTAEAADISEQKIHDRISKANYCSTDNDCVRLETDCPFSCGTVTNKLEKEKLTRTIEEYFKKHPDSRCDYDCYAPPSMVTACEKGKCVLK